MAANYSSNLLKNVHSVLSRPEEEEEESETFLVKGDYQYWHYGCDGLNDRVTTIYYAPNN